MRTSTVAMALALVAAGVGGGWVAATEAPATFDACYRTTTGALRIDTGTGCRVGEEAITLGSPEISTRVVMASDVMTWNDQGVVYAMCAPGEVVVGGGYTIDNIGPMTFVNMDQPLEDEDGNQGWMIMATYTAFEDDGYVGHVSGYAICTAGVTTDAPWLH